MSEAVCRVPARRAAWLPRLDSWRPLWGGGDNTRLRLCGTSPEQGHCAGYNPHSQLALQTSFPF